MRTVRFPWKDGSFMWVDVGRWNFDVFRPSSIFVWVWNEGAQWDCIFRHWSFGMWFSVTRFEDCALEDAPS